MALVPLCFTFMSVARLSCVFAVCCVSCLALSLEWSSRPPGCSPVLHRGNPKSTWTVWFAHHSCHSFVVPHAVSPSPADLILPQPGCWIPTWRFVSAPGAQDSSAGTASISILEVLASGGQRHVNLAACWSETGIPVPPPGLLPRYPSLTSLTILSFLSLIEV